MTNENRRAAEIRRKFFPRPERPVVVLQRPEPAPKVPHATGIPPHDPASLRLLSGADLLAGIVADACSRHRVTIHEIRGPDKGERFRRARVDVLVLARRHGFTVRAAADAINRSPTTCQNILKRAEEGRVEVYL